MFNNTVGELASLPVVLQSFYSEEVRSELTGKQVEEVYTAVDVDGVETERVRLVDEYEDVTYLVENVRSQQTPFEKVEQVINKHEGNNDNVVDMFIGFYLDTNFWEFHDAYIEWLEASPNEDDAKYTETDGEGVFIYSYSDDYLTWEGLEPTDKPTETLEEFKLGNYAILRKAAYSSGEQQLEMQVDGVWESHITEVKGKYPKERI